METVVAARPSPIRHPGVTYDHQASVRALLAEQLPNLRTYARALTSDPSDAEDLVHTTAVRVLTFADKYQRGTNFKAWVHTILRNQFMSWCRTRRRKAPCSLDAVGEAALAVAPSQESAASYSDLGRALAHLPHEQRVVLEDLACGFSYSESARRRNCPVGTTKSRASRGRQAAQAFLAW